jgi:transaldolase/glucose-6-phosphate isomerase
MSTNPLQKLAQFDQSIWLDVITRDMLVSGQMEQYITEDKVKGVTSNPSIFQKAFDSGDAYDADIRSRALQGKDIEGIYESVAIEDIQFATDLFRRVYDETDGGDGFVSLEVSPHLAHDTEGSIKEARHLWEKVNRPNAFIKIPGTKEGIPAIEQCLSEGININITLLFGLPRYKEVANAYLSGLEKRLKAGKSIDHIASVASFFLSRIDVLVDPMIEEFMDGNDEKAELAKKLHGQTAIASAKKAYQIYKDVFNSDRFKKLTDAGAGTQRVLWASTSTKNPDYSDVKYVEALIGPETINTIPIETLDAYRDHGNPEKRLEDDLDKAEHVMKTLPKLNINIDDVTQQLIDEGIEKFNKPFDKLMDVIEKQQKDALSSPVNYMDVKPGSVESAIQKRLDEMENQNFNQRIWEKDAALWKDDKDSKEMIPGAMGWIDVAEKMIPAVPRLQHFAREIREEGFTHVVHMGMGGSSMAPLLFERVFEKGEDGLNLTVLDTTNPETIQQIENDVPLDKTLFIVASKSGSTAEPNAFGDYFYHQLKSVTDEPGTHFVAITDPETSLVEKAEKQNYRRIFLNFEDIGGRYSALSYFGMVPAVLKDINIGGLLEHALRMQHASNTIDQPDENPALALGAVMGECALQGRDKLTLVLPESLSTLGMWLEQLVAESTGKEGKGILPVTGEALLEPKNYGDDRLFVYLHLKDEKDSETEKKLIELNEAGHPVISIEIEEKTDIAQEFYRWEMAVAAAGAIIGINAFNQPNVQGSKDATNKLLKKVEEEGSLPEDEPALQEDGLQFYSTESANSADELLHSFLNQAQPGNYISLQAYINENASTEKLLQKLRTKLQKQHKVATTIGYGPRFLHSTGQYHKGGPNTGLFIQFTADDESDVGVSGADYSFSVFQHAQAQGDLESLRENDRRALRIDLNSDVSGGLEKLAELVSQKESKPA